MNYQYRIVCFIASVCISICLVTKQSTLCTAVPYFSYRSQTYDAARELVGWANDYHINLFDMCDYYGSFSATPEYTDSFRSNEFARCLLGDAIITNNCENATIFVQGSQVAFRSDRAWLADYFGLPTDYQSTITLAPHISNALIDFNWYMGLDPWMEGLYFRVHGPLVYTRWELNACETVHDSGINGYDSGYFAATSISRDNLNPTALRFLGGNGTVNTAHIEALSFSRWNTCSNTKTKESTETKLSDVVMALGWNFFQCEDYHLGLNLRVSAPAGTRPEGKQFFEAIVGNGHHPGLGSGLTSHVILWRDCEYEQYFGLYLDVNLLHLFSTTQQRVFDLKGKPNSRYALAARLTTPVGNNLQGNPQTITGTIQPGFPPVTNVEPATGYIPSVVQFKSEFTSVANLTRSMVDVSVAIQGNVVILFDYTNRDWSLDIGYSFFGRSCENIDIKCDCNQFTQDSWVLKGDANMYGYPIADWASPLASFPFSGIITDAAIALAPSQANATIFNGANRNCTALIATEKQQRNPSIDNAEFAYSDPISGGFPGVFDPLLARPIDTPIPFTDLLINNSQTRTSIQPRFIKQCDFDCKAAQIKYISNKLFFHASYTWSECECWIPYLGLGGKVEFGQTTDDNCCLQDCAITITTLSHHDVCKSCAVSEWGVWLKGGISFH